MEYPSEIIRELISQLVKIPGIGQRSALRIVLNLLKQSREDTEALAENIIKLKTSIRYCKKCQGISDDESCKICSDHTRDCSQVCVVEDIRDVIAIENTHQYKGLYYVLGGLISPVEGVGPADLNLHLLQERAEKEKLSEIIFALNATIEGDTTMFYIARMLSPYHIKMSALSRGISIGGELEYADEVTLGRSLVNRTSYSI